MNNAFNVRIGWLILRILAVVFAWDDIFTNWFKGYLLR